MPCTLCISALGPCSKPVLVCEDQGFVIAFLIKVTVVCNVKPITHAAINNIIARHINIIK